MSSIATDPAAFVARAQQITNTAALAEALDLFHDDCVADWVLDGIREHHAGKREVSRAMTAMIGVFGEMAIHGEKALVCADDHTIVNTWRGGFRGDDRQFGTEIWTLADDGRVIHHQMYLYLSVVPRWSIRGIVRQIRLLLASPQAGWSEIKHIVNARREFA